MRPGIAHFLVLVLLAGCPYLAGLPGTFVFDDYHVVVTNDALDLERFDHTAILDAAFSTRTGPLKRPLSMLTLTANRTVGGLSVIGYKATNIAIHVLNALLVYLLIARLAGFIFPTTFIAARQCAFIATALWASTPMHVTSVLYVSQRMTSLSATLMLTAAVIYVWLRAYQPRTRRAITVGWCAIIGLAVAAPLVKENALLLVPLLLVIEWTALKRIAKPRWLQRITFAALGAAVLVVVYLIVTPEFLSVRYAERPFTLIERLATESRVLFMYLHWLLVPDLNALGLFHDDVVVSRGLLSPPTTILAIAAWCAVILFTAMSKRAYVHLGVAWFLVGHLLESTVYPLELVHEHRNYLPSLGLVLILVGLGLESFRRLRMSHLVTMLAVVAVLANVAVTVQRAKIWSDERSLAESQLARHPNSPRSLYEFARLMLETAGPVDSDSYRTGMVLMQRAQVLADDPTLPLAAQLKSALGRGDEEQATRILDAVDAEVPRVRADVFKDLARCQAFGACPADPAVIVRLADGLLNDTSLPAVIRGPVIEWLALWYLQVLGDTQAAVKMLADLMDSSEGDLTLQVRYLEVLEADGQTHRAVTSARQLLAQSHWLERLNQRHLYRRLRTLVERAGV